MGLQNLHSIRDNFIIIGLTGSLGSGCTTIGKILSDPKQTFPRVSAGLDLKNKFDSLEERRFDILLNYYTREHQSSQFFHLRVSDILFLLLVYTVAQSETNNIDKIIEVINNSSIASHIETDQKNFFATDKESFNDNFQKIIDIANNFFNNFILSSEATPTQQNGSIDFTEEFQKRLALLQDFIEIYIIKNEFYLIYFQNLGKNIREKGEVINKLPFAFPNNPLDSIFLLPEIIRKIISIFKKTLLKNNKKVNIVIDSLRNPYEIEFFKNRYNSFYLFSILAEEVTRDDRLRKHAREQKFTINLDEIKDTEKAKNNTGDHDIPFCISKGDIFIDNNASLEYLKYQLFKYVALIKRPGLLTPTNDERYMQLALTAKYNSGCISRQVGAAVVGDDGYVRGIGWNDVPETSIPCLYRTPQLLLDNPSILFSEYEKTYDFQQFIRKNIPTKLLNKPFCFKDKQNELELKTAKNKIYEKHQLSIEEQKFADKIINEFKFKNPTRERALHAEENAFLQITKSGGQSVINGTLYTTASPCALCAKKAMQLKIKRIVYIDPYPDISNDQILKFGDKEVWPKLDFLVGAVDTGYFRLYSPMIGIKDQQKFL